MTAVVAHSRAFQAAVAELPASGLLSDAPEGAIHVVDDADGVARAVAAGASVIVIASQPTSCDELASIAAVRGDVPVLVHRPLVSRAPMVETGASAITVEVAAPAPELREAIHDAIGCARRLSGGPLALAAATAASRGVSALLLTHAGLPVTVLAHRLVSGSARFDVQTLGETRVSVRGCDGQGLHVERAGETGALIAPPHYESAERATLRRALRVEQDRTQPTDLQELDHDAALAAAIVSHETYQQD